MRNYCNFILNNTFIDPKTVLEIGSNDGVDANILKEFFNIEDQNVWVVEPNPSKHSEIFSKFPKFNLIKFAINDKTGEFDFNQVPEENSGTSSLLNRYDEWYSTSQSKKIKVKTITGKSLLKIINKPEIDLCKIDVEGLTYEVLDSFGDELTKIKSFHLENEHILIWENQKLYDEVKNFLISKGYDQIYFEYVNNSIQSDSVWVLKKLIKK